jgi:hypothetical protein
MVFTVSVSQFYCVWRCLDSEYVGGNAYSTLTVVFIVLFFTAVLTFCLYILRSVGYVKGQSFIFFSLIFFFEIIKGAYDIALLSVYLSVSVHLSVSPPNFLGL